MTMMSTSRAASRERSTKHSETIGHRPPRHSCALTDTWRQARSETPGTSSSRSPESVTSAQSRSRTTSAPRREACWSTAPTDISVSVSSSGKPPSSLWAHR